MAETESQNVVGPTSKPYHEGTPPSPTQIPLNASSPPDNQTTDNEDQEIQNFRLFCKNYKHTRLQNRRSSLPVSIAQRSPKSTRCKKPECSVNMGDSPCLEYRRGSSSSLPDSSEISAYSVMMGIGYGSGCPPTPSLSQQTDIETFKKKQRERFLRIFFCEYRVHKVLCSIPFGILLTASVIGLSTSPYIFICYIFLFSFLVIYPLLCLGWTLYTYFLPYYELCKYAPEVQSIPEKEKEEDAMQDKEEDLSSKEVLKVFDKRLTCNFERRPSTRRPSALPAIKERGTEEEDNTEDE